MLQPFYLLKKTSHYCVETFSLTFLLINKRFCFLHAIGDDFINDCEKSLVFQLFKRKDLIAIKCLKVGSKGIMCCFSGLKYIED